jgi:hypothetical protein
LLQKQGPVGLRKKPSEKRLTDSAAKHMMKIEILLSYEFHTSPKLVSYRSRLDEGVEVY